jgi:hypothetical protein
VGYMSLVGGNRAAGSSGSKVALGKRAAAGAGCIIVSRARAESAPPCLAARLPACPPASNAVVHKRPSCICPSSDSARLLVYSSTRRAESGSLILPVPQLISR